MKYLIEQPRYMADEHGITLRFESRRAAEDHLNQVNPVGSHWVVEAKPPYPEFCRHPDKCSGLGSCPRDPVCCD